jgi:hypothetical protein
MVGAKVPIGHAVIKQDSGIAGDQTRTPSALDTLKLADSVAPSVHYDETGCVFLLRTDPGGDMSARAFFPGNLVRPGVARRDL